MNPDAPLPRRRAPRYDVYEHVDLPDAPQTAWMLVAEGVRAANDKLAIQHAVAGRPEHEQYGTFFAVLTGTIKPRTRAKRVVHQDVWE